MQKRTDYVWLYLSVAVFLVMSVSFLLMENFSIIAGAMFWIGLLFGIITQFILAKRRKISLKGEGKSRRQRKLGVVTFFRNRLAVIVDIVFILSVAGVIVAWIFTNGVGYICYCSVSIFVFSFCMHCIFNGENYYYVVNKDK